MRSKIIAFLLISLTAPLYAQDKFSLGSIVVSKPATPQTTSISIEVNTVGPPPSLEILQNPKNWQVYVTESDSSILQLQAFSLEWLDTRKIKINFDKSQIGGRDPRLVNWGILFTGVFPNLTSSREAPKKPSLFEASKGKDDAAIYLFGSFLTGVSTKPIYAIDAKFDWLFEIPTGKVDPSTNKRGGNGWFIGVKASLSANTDAKPPADRTRVDPDSIEGALTISHMWTPSAPSRKLSGVLFDLRPIGGEFSRKYPASNLLTKGNVTFALAPQKIAEDLWFAFYPSVGYEIGKNLNQPRILFNKPIDLTNWDTIGRATFITKVELYKFRPKPKEKDEHVFTLDAIYQPRIPLTREPFVTTEFINGKREAVLRMRKNARHQIEAGVNWNFSPFLGFRAQYRYGSLPPLFQFVDHQATIGLVFKAKQVGRPY